MKCNNIHIMGIPKGEWSELRFEYLFEDTMTENFPHLVKEKDTQVQKSHKDPNKMYPKRPIPRHIIINTSKLKNKEKILKAARENQVVINKGAPIRLSSDLSTETF